MTRKKPDMAPPEFKPQPRPDVITLERHYEVITPLFGGGAVAGEVDTAHPIRGSSIRGHLRFWWRATQAGRFASLQVMKAAEDALWGSAEAPSQVKLFVQNAYEGEPFNNADINGHALNYVAFDIGDVQHNFRSKVTFKLQVSFPKNEENSIKATFWAWDTFGGIGSRTRRGFGALHCYQCDEIVGDTSQSVNQNWCWIYTSDSAETQIKKSADEYVEKGISLLNVPHLDPTIKLFKVAKHNKKAIKVWEQLITALKNFRQSRNGQFGRSHWPEPDALRHRTGRSLPVHSTPVHGTLIDKFPRAQFGLPIKFKFKDYADPPITDLVGINHERLASPLIIRPINCTDDTAVGIALVLDTPRIPPGGLKLKNAPATGTAPIADIDVHEAGLISTKHPTLNSQTDVLKAFLDTL